MADDEIISDEDVLARFSARVEEDVRRKKAEQDFINLLIQQTHDAGAFHSCPDRDNLYNIVELALRLALTCHKQEGRGPVNGYGIASKFIQAVRRHVEDHEREKRADAERARQKRRAMAKDLKAHGVALSNPQLEAYQELKEKGHFPCADSYRPAQALVKLGKYGQGWISLPPDETDH